MKSPHSTHRPLLGAALALTAVTLAACGLEEQSVPATGGPSGLAHAFTLAASPTQLPRDGSSQSTVTLRATDPTGGPLVGQRFTLSISPTEAAPGVTEVTTDANGRATFVVTAPTLTSSANSISITATAVGGFSDSARQFLTVSLTGSPNTGAAVPSFSWTPDPAEIQQMITFDASATTDEGASCSSTCTFAWSFSDGVTASGPTFIRTFTTAGARNLTLTVTDPVGLTSTLTQVVPVSDVDPPSVSGFGVVPSPAVADQTAVFSATATANGTNHRIVQYLWTFGDGTTATTTHGTVTKVYAVPGEYIAVVTATDDLGRSNSATLEVTVVSAEPDPPVARFTVTPAQPRVGQVAQFDARSSTAGTRAVIVRYSWSFGDGTTVITSTPTIGHTYTEARIYPVTLVVTDDRGQTSQVGQSVTVVD